MAHVFLPGRIGELRRAFCERGFIDDADGKVFVAEEWECATLASRFVEPGAELGGCFAIDALGWDPDVAQEVEFAA